MSKLSSRAAIAAALLLIAAACGGSSDSDSQGSTTTVAERTTTTEAAATTTTTTEAASATTTEPAPSSTAMPGDLDISVAASFGDLALDPGFSPDPSEVDVVSGGMVDVSYIAGCTGWAASAPDLELVYGAGGSYLRIYFEADATGDDATIIINGPDGEWYCNDDFSGVDPAIEFLDPQAGIYDIWIGSYSEGEYLDGTIGITEFSPAAEEVLGGSLSFSETASFGDLALDPGFSPDPSEVDVVSGGMVDVSYIAGCTGWAASAPDLELVYGAGGSYLRIYFEADATGDDATIIINGPDGEWYCNDDFSGVDPAIEFLDPQAGIYDIWIGSYSEGEYLQGAIGITEFAF